MQTPIYDPTGAYMVWGGLIVSILQHFGYVIEQNDAVTVISGLVIMIGFIKQVVNHKKMAVAAGAIEK